MGPQSVPLMPAQRAKDVEWGDVLAACREAGDVESESWLRKAMADDPDDLPELSRRWGKKEPGVQRTIRESFASLRDQTSIDDLEAALSLPDPAAAAHAVEKAVPLAAWHIDSVGHTVAYLRDTFVLGANVGGEAAGLPTKAPHPVFARVNPEAVTWAKANAGRLLTDLTTATQAGIRAAVVNGLELGWHPTKLARVIRSSVGLTDRQATAVVRFADRLASADENLADEKLFARVERYAEAQSRMRALTIARTELASAASAGQQRLWEIAVEDGVLDDGRMQKRWLATLDEITHEGCEQLATEQVGIDEVFSNGKLHPPDHPNCVPGDALITAGAGISAVSKRWYQGDLVIIRTAGGQQISCTPNHPILTDRGWIAACLLHEGSNVITGHRSESMTPRIDRYDVNVPTRIEEIADAFSVSPTSTRREVITSAPYFHGDGLDGEVAIIWTNGSLWRDNESILAQRSIDEAFGRGHASSGFDAFGLAKQAIQRTLATAHGGMRRVNEILSFWLTQLGPSPLIAFADAGATGMTSVHVRAPFILRRQFGPKSFSGDARIVVRARRPGRDAGVSQEHPDSQFAYTIPSRQALNRIAGLITAQRVISIEHRRFEGHVYNIQTEHEWYAAGNIITHNCRCASGLIISDKASPAPEPWHVELKQAVKDGFEGLRADLTAQMSQQPIINVQVPTQPIHVHMPPRSSRERIIDRDEMGNVVRIYDKDVEQCKDMGQ